MKTHKLRVLNALIAASVASTAFAFAVGFAAMAWGISQAGDYIVDVYVISMLIGVPLCLARFRRRDDQARLTLLEREVMTSVAMHLPRTERDVFDQQVQAISRVERLSSGKEVKFHLGGTGRNPYLPLPLLANRNSSAIAVLKLASLEPGTGAEVTVWSHQGRLSAMVYQGEIGSLTVIKGTTLLTDVKRD